MYREKKKRNRTSVNLGQEQKGWKIAGKGLVLAWLLTVGLLPVAAMCIYLGWFDPNVIPVLAKIIMIISMVAAGIYVFRNTKGNGRIWILIMLIGYLAVRFLLSLILTFL